MQAQNDILNALECVCSIFHHFGIDYVSPRLFRAAIKINHLRTKEHQDDISNPLLKSIMCLILMHKTPNFSLESIRTLWKRAQFDPQLASYSARLFLFQNQYPRSLLFHSSCGRELLFALCWLFIQTEITRKYLSFFSDENMFFPDPSAAYSEQLSKTPEDCFDEDIVDVSLEGLSNKLISKVNKVYNICNSLTNKSKHNANLVSQLNDIQPGVTPTEFHIIVDSYATMGTKGIPQKYLDFEKEIHFHAVVYNHVSAFVAWVEETAAKHPLDIETLEEPISIGGDCNQIRDQTIRLYQQLRSKLLDNVALLNNNQKNSKRLSNSLKSDPPLTPHIHQFIQSYALNHQTAVNRSERSSPFSKQKERLIKNNHLFEKIKESSSHTPSNNELSEEILKNLNSKLESIKLRLSEKRERRKTVLE